MCNSAPQRQFAPLLPAPFSLNSMVIGKTAGCAQAPMSSTSWYSSAGSRQSSESDGRGPEPTAPPCSQVGLSQGHGPGSRAPRCGLRVLAAWGEIWGGHRHGVCSSASQRPFAPLLPAPFSLSSMASGKTAGRAQAPMSFTSSDSSAGSRHSSESDGRGLASNITAPACSQEVGLSQGPWPRIQGPPLWPSAAGCSGRKLG